MPRTWDEGECPEPEGLIEEGPVLVFGLDGVCAPYDGLGLDRRIERFSRYEPPPGGSGQDNWHETELGAVCTRIAEDAPVALVDDWLVCRDGSDYEPSARDWPGCWLVRGLSSPSRRTRRWAWARRWSTSCWRSRPTLMRRSAGPGMPG